MVDGSAAVGERGPGRTRPWSRTAAPQQPYVSSVTGSSTLEVTLTREERIELLQAVADPVRWAVLEQLGDTTKCVCDIRENIPVPANLLSYHLRVLRDAGLVTSNRRGRWIDYALAADAVARMRAALPGTPGCASA